VIADAYAAKNCTLVIPILRLTWMASSGSASAVCLERPASSLDCMLCAVKPAQPQSHTYAGRASKCALTRFVGPMWGTRIDDVGSVRVGLDGPNWVTIHNLDAKLSAADAVAPQVETMRLTSLQVYIRRCFLDIRGSRPRKRP
jgi:hypothetical protein